MESRVYLRALEPDDYKTSIAWRNDDQIWDMLGGVKYYVSENYEREWVQAAIKDNSCIRLAVCLKENDLYIGNVYITNINWQTRCGVSHVLIGNKDYWGKGYAREAYTLLLKYAFEERNLHRIEAHILECNQASIRMHLKTGYTQEGILRESVFKKGRYQNQVVMSILEKDFLK